MPLPKKFRRKKGNEDDEAKSVTPMEPAVGETTQDETLQAKETRLLDALDVIGGKQGAGKKKAALDTLVKAMSESLMFEFVEKHQATMTKSLLALARKGDGAMVEKAVRLLGLVSISGGDDDSANAFSTSWSVLKTLFRNQSKAPEVRAAALSGAAFLCVLGSTELNERANCLAAFEAIARHGLEPSGIPDVTAAGLQAYGLVATQLQNRELAGIHRLATLQLWQGLLGHSALTIRGAAGTNFALVYSACAALRQKEEKGEAEAQELVSACFDFNAVTDLLCSLVADSSKQKARAEKRQQRRIYREIIKTLQEGEEPWESIKVYDDTHLFRGWRKSQLLHACRGVLGAGLNVHLHGNPRLADLLDLQIETVGAEMVDAPSTKDWGSSVSKQAVKTARTLRQRDRSRKGDFMAHGDSFD